MFLDDDYDDDDDAPWNGPPPLPLVLLNSFARTYAFVYHFTYHFGFSDKLMWLLVSYSFFLCPDILFTPILAPSF